MKLYPVIGIETHIQLNTKTKLFCRCLNEYAPDEPNKNICPFCTGQPGALPLLNKEAVKKAIIFGVAINAKIPNKTRWDRKNYFYPDLPAGYQISQYDNPIVEGGHVEFYVEKENGKDFEKISVELTRAHLEADAGKLLHVGDKTLVDFNRSGAPLIEIVTEPVVKNSQQAMAYVNEIQLLARTLGISDADMEKGQMRFDCNLSLQTEEEHVAGKLPKYKVEVKNINSPRAIGRAVEYEIIRQTELLERGEKPTQETRGWRDDLNKSVSQRSKEDAMDYRYFPEPDLQILEIRESDIPKISDLPTLPNAKRQKYLDKDLSYQVANTFTTKPEVAELFDKVENILKDKKLVKTAANIVTGNLLAIATKSEKSIGEILKVEQIAGLAELFEERKINNQGLIKAIDLLIETPDKSALEIVTENNLIQVNDDSALGIIVESVIANNTSQVEQYKAGKVQIIGFLVGQCMKESKGQGNPQRFKELLEGKLS